MGLHVGQGGPRQRGRPKGIPWRKKTEFRDWLWQMCAARGVDPFVFMADMIADTSTVALGVDSDGRVVEGPLVSMSLKFNAAKELASYMERKLATVKLVDGANNPLKLELVQYGTKTGQMSLELTG